MSVALEEFESVKDIYEGFQVISNDSKNPKCKLPLSPSNASKDEIYVALNVTFRFPEQYPLTPPLISFEPTGSMRKTFQTFYHTFKENEDILNLTKTQNQSLLNSINGYYKENENENNEMLFDLIGIIQEWIDDNNNPPTNDNYNYNYNNNKNEEEKKEKEKEKEKEAKQEEYKTNDKPKILMLHAYKQNGKIFRQRCKNFIKLLSDKFELKYPNAPFKLNGTQSCPNPYCWYKYPKLINNDDDEQTNLSNLSNLLQNYKMVQYIQFFELLVYFMKFLIDECYEDNSSFIGLIGFSQGATFGTILIWLSSLTDDLFEQLIILPHLEIMNKIGLYGLFRKYGSVFNKYLKIKACVLMSAHLYPLPKQLESSYYHFIMSCNDKEIENDKEREKTIKWNKLQSKSLHTMSKNDKWVNIEKSQDMLPLFQYKEIIQHENGHSCYNNKYVAQWLCNNL